MNKENIKRSVYSQLYIVKGMIDSILLMINELEELYDKECLHPKNERQNLSVMGGKEHWICNMCGYEYIEE